MTHPEMEKLRSHVFGGGDTILYTHLGYFFTWFGKVELDLTFILSMVSQSSNTETFELLVKGMDARVKVERLRSLCKKRMPIVAGSNFAVRLNLFENQLIPLRNKLTHTSLALSESGEARIFLSSLNRLPMEELGEKRPFGFGERPEELTLIDLFQQGLWLNLYSDDLTTVFDRIANGQSLEIEKPRSPVPKAAPGSPRHKESHAKNHKRDRIDPQ